MEKRNKNKKEKNPVKLLFGEAGFTVGSEYLR